MKDLLSKEYSSWKAALILLYRQPTLYGLLPPPFLQENLVPLPSMIFQKSQPPINEGGSHYENICNICSKSIIMTLKQFLCSCESYSGVSVVDLQQEFICPLVQSYCSSMFINKLAFIVYQKMLWLAENNLA